LRLQSKLLQRRFPRKRKSKLLKIIHFQTLFLSLKSHLKELPVQFLSKLSTSLRLFLSPRPSDSRLSKDTRAPSTDSLKLLFIKDLIILATHQSPSSSQKKESPSLATLLPIGHLLKMANGHLMSKLSSLTYPLTITTNANIPNTLSPVARI
jgi:hypothetical protein